MVMIEADTDVVDTLIAVVTATVSMKMVATTVTETGTKMKAISSFVATMLLTATVLAAKPVTTLTCTGKTDAESFKLVRSQPKLFLLDVTNDEGNTVQVALKAGTVTRNRLSQNVYKGDVVLKFDGQDYVVGTFTLVHSSINKTMRMATDLEGEKNEANLTCNSR